MREKKIKIFIHDSACIDKGARIGQGTTIWHFTHVMKGASIGGHCMLGQNVHIGSNVKIGNGVKIQNNVSIFEGVQLEDDVFVGPGAVFTNVLTPRAFISRKREFKSTIVGKGATIGANATIVCGNLLGPYSFVGAGAVVTKNVKSYALVVGNPARQVGWVCSCGCKLSVKLLCLNCGANYKFADQGLFLLNKHD